MITSVIKHDIRSALKLTCMQYVVMDAMIQTGNNKTSEYIAACIGAPVAQVDDVLTYIQDNNLGRFCETKSVVILSDDTINQLTGVAEVKPVERKKKESVQIADDVIKLFNHVNGTRYEPATYAHVINSIVKQHKEITATHFESVIRHKFLTWGNDDTMREYNRPGTIFRSVQKFMQYLDDARVYWGNKTKENLDYVELGR